MYLHRTGQAWQSCIGARVPACEPVNGMASAYDVIVVGLGATGSAALYHLARRNARVLGLDRFEPGHERGSSHGRTRIIRQAYFEHPCYVPLVRRAYTLWRELERASGRSLLTVTGIAEIGRPDSRLITGTLAAAREHNLTHQVLSAPELMRRYPAFRLPQDFVAVWQPDGGFVEAEAAVRTHLQLAVAAGAEVRSGERVTVIEQAGDRVRLITERRMVEAGCAIVAAGAWAGSLLPGLKLPLTATRQVLVWTQPAQPELFRTGWFPVFMIESGDGIHYGFPLRGDEGLKLAKHHHRHEVVDPDSYDRTVSASDEAAILAPLSRHLPAAIGPVVAAKTCLYTMAPDGHFLIDRISDNVIIASPCSGHGFKFSPAIGQSLASLALGGPMPADFAPFRLSRLAGILPAMQSAQ